MAAADRQPTSRLAGAAPAPPEDDGLSPAPGWGRFLSRTGGLPARIGRAFTNSPKAASRIRKVCRSERPRVLGLLANHSRHMPDSSRRGNSRRKAVRHSRKPVRHNSRRRCSRSRHRLRRQPTRPLPSPGLDNQSPLRNLCIPIRRRASRPSGPGSNCQRPLISCLPHWSAKEPHGASRRCRPSRLRRIRL